MSHPVCICRCISSSLNISRFFGLFPIRWAHQNGKCVFRTSKLWIAYSLIFAAINVFHLCKIYGVIVRPFLQDRSLLLNYIASINEYIISFFMLLLIFVDIYRAPRIVRVLNRFVALADKDLLCQNSLKMNSIIHRLFGVTMFLQYFIQFSLIFLFGFLETFAADWSYARFIMPIIHNTSFLFYSVFGSFCVLSDSILHCFENKICSVLQFASVHPVSNFGRKKIRSTLWWKYVMCKETHGKCPPNLNAVGRLEYLQALYTELQNNLEALNQAFNPQILLHVSNEVIVMVFQWYAVIVYFTYDKVTSSDNTNNFFHWYYIIIHSWAMGVALNLAQRVETKIERYKIILLEHSTTVSSVEEHQQLRIFVQTLQNFKGFTANGIFNVNLQISAPICANILMYVLVAIQFKFPTKDV